MHTTELSQFPPAERWALVRDGHAIVADGIICTIDSLPGSCLRLDAHFSSINVESVFVDAVAIEQSALWVLGAVPSAPSQPSIAGLDGARLYVGSGNAHVRELGIHRGDCLSFGGRLVTDPSRTAADIARHSPNDDMALEDLTALARRPGYTSQHALDIVARSVHVPFSRRARTRLGAAFTNAVGIVDPVNASNGVEQPIEMAGVTHLKDESVEC